MNNNWRYFIVANIQFFRAHSESVESLHNGDWIVSDTFPNIEPFLIGHPSVKEVSEDEFWNKYNPKANIERIKNENTDTQN